MSRWLVTALLAVCFGSPLAARVVEPPAPIIEAVEAFGDEAVREAAPLQSGPVSLAQAAELARQRFPGRVVRAETVTRSGRREHHIRILGEEGRVRTVRIDAQSGAFL